jgi:WD40 repeat protein
VILFSRYWQLVRSLVVRLPRVEVNYLLGCEDGDVYVFGDRGVQVKLSPKCQGRIVKLSFHVEGPVLLIVDSKNNLWCFSLVTGELRYHKLVSCQITAFDTPAVLEWCFVGTRLGDVQMYHVKTGRVSNYVITDALRITSTDQGLSSSVCSLHLNPADPNLLLIGYENEAVVWNLKQKQVAGRYTLLVSESTKVYLTKAVWKPDGQQFCAAYSDGYYAFWDQRNEQTPLFASQLDPGDNEFKEPIFQMYWCFLGEDDTVLVFVGGKKEGLNGVSFLKIQGKQCHWNTIPTFHELPFKVADMVLFTSSPSMNEAHLPHAIILISTSGTIHALDFQSLKPLDIPFSLSINEKKLKAAQLVVDIPRDIYIAATKHPVNAKLPILGGKFEPAEPLPDYDMLVLQTDVGDLTTWAPYGIDFERVCTLCLNVLVDGGVITDSFHLRNVSMCMTSKENLIMCFESHSLIIFLSCHKDHSVLESNIINTEKEESLSDTAHKFKTHLGTTRKVNESVVEVSTVTSSHGTQLLFKTASWGM